MKRSLKKKGPQRIRPVSLDHGERAMSADERWKMGQGILGCLCLVAMFLTCLLSTPDNKLQIWLVNLALATAFVAFAGKATMRLWWGALIDEQNSMSLARLQITLWTIVIGSAYVTAATTNALAGEDSAVPSMKEITDAQVVVTGAKEDLDRVEAQLKEGGGASKQPELAKRKEELREERTKREQTLKELEAARHRSSAVIAIPTAVWLLLGISLSSLAGSPLILSYKKEQPPSEEQKAKTIEALKQQKVDPATLESKGLVIAKREPKDASIADFFRGEETGNAARLDLGRVQLLFFMIGVLVAYAIALGARFRLVGPIHEFPDLDTSLAALLGVSNAGYLLNKAAPHSEAKS
jgi:hypothetical protein